MKIFLIKYLPLFFLLFLYSCLYDNFTVSTLKVDDNFINYYYARRNNNKLPNKSLIIYLDGSAYCSTLGIMSSYNSWEALTLANQFNEELSDKYDMLIPEKMNINMGEDFAGDSLKSSANTLTNRIYASVIVIDSFLNKTSYENIYLVGYSEGGLIIPRVYNNIKTKEKISRLIVLSCGGYSYYNIIKAMYKSRKLDTLSIDSIIVVINKNSNSLSKSAFGNVYKKWSDFMFYEPAEEYKNIGIPVLLIHGTNDQYSPIESARFLKSKFIQWNKTNLTYIEFENMNHNFNGDFKTVIKRIEKWLID